MTIKPFHFAAVFLLLLSACDKGQQKTLETTSGSQKMEFAIPAVLDTSVDLNNQEAVAKALGVRLTGDPKQFLYNIVMTAPSTEGTKTRTIPIRVDNIKQGSKIVYSIEGEHAVKEMPKKKAVSKKKKPKG
jgi:hypothetical protein